MKLHHGYIFLSSRHLSWTKYNARKAFQHGEIPCTKQYKALFTIPWILKSSKEKLYIPEGRIFNKINAKVCLSPIPPKIPGLCIPDTNNSSAFGARLLVDANSGSHSLFLWLLWETMLSLFLFQHSVPPMNFSSLPGTHSLLHLALMKFTDLRKPEQSKKHAFLLCLQLAKAKPAALTASELLN